MSKLKHTPGSWYTCINGKIWRRPPDDLYEYGGTVAGDQPIAQAFIGWRAKDLKGYNVESNARLIAAAPEMLDALIDNYKFYAMIAGQMRIVNNDAEWLHRMKSIADIIERATGMIIDEVLSNDV